MFWSCKNWLIPKYFYDGELYKEIIDAFGLEMTIESEYDYENNIWCRKGNTNTNNNRIFEKSTYSKIEDENIYYMLSQREINRMEERLKKVKFDLNLNKIFIYE